jgi:hypothetical protein
MPRDIPWGDTSDGVAPGAWWMDNRQLAALRDSIGDSDGGGEESDHEGYHYVTARQAPRDPRWLQWLMWLLLAGVVTAALFILYGGVS